MQAHVVVARADHRRSVVVLGLPAPGQPVARRAGRGRRSTRRSAGTTVTPSRCCASSPWRADAEADGHKGAQLVVPARPGRRAAARDRLAAAGGCSTSGDRSMIVRRRVRLDRGAARRRLRPPADRHVAALAAAPRAARRRVLERGARDGHARRAAGRLRREAAPRRGPRALGRLPGLLRPARRPVRAGRSRRPRAARTAGRLPRSACCPATCTTPTWRRRTTRRAADRRRSTS